MIKIIGKRGSGKTTKLLGIAAQTGDTVVCCNKQYAKEMAQKTIGLPIDIISYSEFMHERGKRKRYLIDEIDLFLSYAFPFKNIAGYSIDEGR